VGTVVGNAEKDTPPQAVEWGGVGKRAGGPRFSRPRLPRNKLYQEHHLYTIKMSAICNTDWNLSMVEAYRFLLPFPDLTKSMILPSHCPGYIHLTEEMYITIQVSI